MTIKQRLLFHSLATPVIAGAIIVFIIINMLSIQSSNQDFVPLMMKAQHLQAELKATKQSLSNYAYSPTEGNKQEVIVHLAESEKLLQALNKGLTEPYFRSALEQANKKFAELAKQSNDALDANDVAEVRRQSMRAEGVLNDVYVVNTYVSEYYTYMQNTLQKQIDRVITVSLVAIAVVLLFAGFSGVRLTRKMSTPLRKIAENAKQIANGNLRIEPVKYNGKDELADLNAAFTTMADQLNVLLQSVDTVSKQVEAFAKEIDEETKTLTEINNQVAVSTNELSAGAQSISEDLQSAVQLIERMEGTVQQNVGRTEQTARYSDEAVEAITHGQAALAEQKGFIDENTKATASIEQSTAQFATYASKIQDMAKAVADIATQTNLLALNAAIEAARAGEAGKGFAVVAEEVRKLAEESSKATSQIFEMVQLIQSGLTNVTEAVRRGVDIAEAQAKAIETTTEAFAQIENKVHHITTDIQALVVGMNESKELGKNVLQNVESISAVVEQSAAGSEQIAASMVEQLEAFKKMSEKVTTLRQLTDDLQQTMAKFQMK
ncbi:methyl-accepting chemotaxis protein [Anoxybacillus ayderensis]|uniref:methyl-accepting chemotaxis protein n=1 Tax=Anoxybacillus ayderensis TaxID=265546 RepID=UPI000A2715B3|nr:methyl-accepting chemotaxis protein [Anoxybacillus ayderensis]OSX54896.1 chemotaxis protein [Anoxybacillus ayderensis]